MPAVNLDRELRMPRLFTSWVKKRMREMKLRNCDLAKELGISSQALGKKFKKDQYTIEDLITIFKVLKAGPDEVAKLLII